MGAQVRRTKRRVAIGVGVVGGIMALGLAGGSGKSTEASQPSERTTSTTGESAQPLPPESSPATTPTTSSPTSQLTTATTTRATTTTAPPPTTTTTAPAPALTIASVTDGDTLRLSDGRKVRLAQVDAPETDECFGTESTAWLRAHVGDRVTLQRPPSAPAQDRYGRWVFEVLTDGTSLNVETVRLGNAGVYEAYADEDPALYQRLTAASAEARAADRGLWSACGSTHQPAGTTSTPTVGTSPTGPTVYYANCDAARAAGVAPLHTGDPGYRSGLDRDHDGVACE